MVHYIDCQEPWFTLVKRGIKPVEGRKNSPKYQAMKPGDALIFTYENQHFETTITAIHHYKSVEKYLEGETLARALPGVKTFEEGVKIYLQWSTREEIERHGFLGIQVKVGKL